MKPTNFNSWRAALARASLVAVLGGLAAPAQAIPCESNFYCDPNDPGAYRLHFDVTSSTVGPITGIMDFFGPHHVANQGDFMLDNLPSLPTGSGTLDAGIWWGEDDHFLLGMAGTHLVFIMNPATAAQMMGHPLEFLVNGIPPVAVPNPSPIVDLEGFLIQRMTVRPVEWEHDIWTLFNHNYYPAALDPTIHIGAGTTTGVLMRFTDGEVLGTVNITPMPIPEPGNSALMLVGLCGLTAWLRRRQG